MSTQMAGVFLMKNMKAILTISEHFYTFSAKLMPKNEVKKYLKLFLWKKNK